nr:immunoglobulin heavy chain junction region [Macaca mulatta]
CARIQSGFYGSGWFLYYIDYW